MKLSKIEGTCSMYTLNDVNAGNWNYSKEAMNLFIKDNFYNIKPRYDDPFKNKCILYNTNYSWFWDFDTRWRMKWVHGFKCIGSYRGLGQKVYIMIKRY